MKIKFKHQQFQEDAVNAVCDVFAGQPKIEPTHRLDYGIVKTKQIAYAIDGKVVTDIDTISGHNNAKIMISNEQILSNLQKIQRNNGLQPSDKIEPFVVDVKPSDSKRKVRKVIPYNLTIEMETGVGKTFTYIKTMFEMNKRYGFKKFIVVVPSVAIREGVHKSFEMTQDYFLEDDNYGKKIRFFIYNSSQLDKIDGFAHDNNINVMIINSQAFNARGKDARRIYMKLDSFRSRRPIDIIAKTNPIVIIDEPQSTEGKVTKEKIPEFNPLIILRYSATHKDDSIYNMVYRLDAMDAYNKKLVKKIAVKGIAVSGSTSTEGYMYLEEIILSKSAPKARLEFEVKTASGIRKKTFNVEETFRVYDESGLEQYDGYTVRFINGRDGYVEFTNGVRIYAGDVNGAVNEEQIRRIQIRETIKSHLEKERELFYQGIKVLSLFFIDEVAKYKQYSSAGQEMNGIYADIFEEEYNAIISEWQTKFEEEDYLAFLDKHKADSIHKGYFSIDKHNHMVDSKAKGKEKLSDDVSAYDLIMRNKEQLLDRKEPTRFIFSHSALREGWDNPNVFQICTLKYSGSDVRKRQEVGRGLRLCVNMYGDRMDENVLSENVHDVNKLTVIANESYDHFCKTLQEQIAENINYRPLEVSANLFENCTIKSNDGSKMKIDSKTANKIFINMVQNGYVDEESRPTDKFYEDKKSGNVKVPQDLTAYTEAITDIVDKVYSPENYLIENERNKDVVAMRNEEQYNKKEFKELWKRINRKTAYIVDFNTEELIKNAVYSLNNKLLVSKIYYKIETGIQTDTIQSKEQLLSGKGMVKETRSDDTVIVEVNSNVKYDLIGKMTAATGLTRKTIVKILQSIDAHTFNMFKSNPEEFIIKASELINEQKATAIIEHITYKMLDDSYNSEEVFTKHPAKSKGKLHDDAIISERGLYDFFITDSKVERDFATELDVLDEVAVYVKLPNAFYISTPVGKYNPDWAIAFYEGKVKHIYFVAETKGTLSTLQLRPIEDAKIKCARKHFKLISSDTVKYDVVDKYSTLLEKVMK